MDNNIKIVNDSNEHYHSHDSISASGLKEIAKNSVYHFINKKWNETPSMAFGTAVHTALLESEIFYDTYYPMPEIKDLRTKEGKLLKKEAEEKSDGRICLSHYDHFRIKKIVENFKKNKLAVEYCKGEKELSHYLKYNGLPVRVRPDVVNHVSGFISDVKTTQSASPKSFRNDVRKFYYSLQAAFYMDMLGVKEFKFIACEVNHPFTVVVYTLDNDLIEYGRKMYKQAFNDWFEYKINNKIKLYHSDYMANDGSYLIK